MSELIRLDIPLVLPGVRDVQDACIGRLMNLLERRDGVESVHVLRPGDPPLDRQHARAFQRDANGDEPQLCLHYDPERITLGQVTELATLAGAQIGKQYGHVVIPFRMVGSEDEGRRLEATLRSTRGITAVSVNLAGQVARVEYDRHLVEYGQILTQLANAGAVPTKRAAALRMRDELPQQASAPARPSLYKRNRELVWSLMAGVFALLGRTVAAPRTVAAYVLYGAAYAFGARDNIAHFVKDLRRGQFHFNIDLLMIVAAVGAAALGEWFEGALLLFLFSLGHALEHYALGRARNAIKALADLAPTTATVIRDGTERVVPIDEVQHGDRAVVKPAERIAVDGVVVEGRSSVNQAPITGESVPVEKVVGGQVFAGSVNGEGVLIVEVTGAAGDRTLDRVIKLVAEASTQKAPTQQFTDRFERVFVPVVLIADALVMVVPPLLGIWPWSVSVYRAMALLVAASPCALALGTPAAVLAGIAQAARKGVLIKGGAHLEVLGTIRILALDKTGTITKGEPEVTNVLPASGSSEAELLGLSSAIERRSQHPLARAVTKAAEARQIAVPDATDVEAITARGVQGTVGDKTVQVGRMLMFKDKGLVIPMAIWNEVSRLEAAGRSTMIARRVAATEDESRRDSNNAVGAQWLGVLGIADQPRANAAATITRLRAAGIDRIVMLTGDNKGVGDAIGKAVGVDEVRAGLLPEDKVTAIQELAQSGRVAMVGDGVNDAPALAHASVGIAMGGAGTAAALETADVALMGDDLGRLPFVIALSRQARAIIRQNLYVSLSVIVLLAGATLMGFARIGPAVVIHEGSTLVVIANALRLLAFEERSV